MLKPLLDLGGVDVQDLGDSRAADGFVVFVEFYSGNKRFL